MKKVTWALLGLLIALQPLAARADIFLVEFTGVVDTVFASPGLASELPVGTEVRFKLAFDTSAVDTCPAANIGFYREPDAGSLSYLGKTYDLFLTNLEVNAPSGTCPTAASGPSTGGYAVYRTLVVGNPTILGATVTWSFTGATPFDPLPSPVVPGTGFWGVTAVPGLSGASQSVTEIRAVPVAHTVALVVIGLVAMVGRVRLLMFRPARRMLPLLAATLPRRRR